jgi:peptidoglycan hydrolase-like protein with peptidoglycan-binding domain
MCSLHIPDFRKDDEKLMLTLRRKILLVGIILVLLTVAFMPWSAYASDYGTKDLTLGSQGSAVSQLQKDLARLGFYKGSIDGWFGPKTLDAVKDFQNSQGLKVDGLVGSKTKAALNAALANNTRDYGAKDLTLGSQGSAVSQLQKDLAQLGFYKGSIDGWFGPKTLDAVKDFQKSQGLKVDGLVGSKTKAILNTALAGIVPLSISATAQAPTAASIKQYNSHEKPIIDSFRAHYNGSLAEALVGRAIWYMEYGFMKYGHTKYANTGYIDCSNFVSLVYKDFGYSITSAAKKYDQVGVKVNGVYGAKIPGTSKYQLVGIEKLKPGDIFTYWNTDEPAGTHIGHVAIYMGKINGKPCIIGTCSGRPTAIGIVNSFAYWYGSGLIEVRRVLPSSAFEPNAPIKASDPVIPAVYQIKPNRPIILPKYLKTGF